MTKIFVPAQKKLQAAEKECENLVEAAGRIMGGIRELSIRVKWPTETELEQIRKRRDAQWQLLRRHWLEGEDVTLESRSFTENDDLPEVYENHVNMADRLSDRLRREADRVHKFAALKADQLANREATETVHENLEKHNAESAAISREWNLLWQPCSIGPLPPKEMLDWSVKFEKIRFGATELIKIEGEINTQKTEGKNCETGF